MQKTVLVVDLGSTKLKAGLYDQDGTALANETSNSPLQLPTLEADTALQAVISAAQAVCGGLRPDAIAITGATRTHVLTAADGKALDAVVKLTDARGAMFEEDVRKAYGMPSARGMGAFHPLARLLDCKTSQPNVYAQTRWQLELKDWLNLQLTGKACTDPVTHTRLIPAGSDSADVLNNLGLRQDLLPGIAAMGQVIGVMKMGPHVHSKQWDGIPVVQCGFDAWCASFGMCCVHDKHVYNVSGTTEVFGSFGLNNLAVKGMSSLQWTDQLHHLGGPCLTGLATLAWFGRSFLNDANPQAVLDCAAQAHNNNSDLPICLPFVSGERMPFWRADLAAQFINVRSQHGLPELARALVDGLMAFQSYLVSVLCPRASTIHLSGGALSLPGWAQMKASAWGVPVQKCMTPEPSLLGAAMAALTAIGHFDSMAQAQERIVTVYETVHPETLASERISLAKHSLFPYFEQLAKS